MNQVMSKSIKMQKAALDSFPPELPLTIIWHGNPNEPTQLDAQAGSSLRELAQQSVNGRFIIAENSGHYITFDRPDIVVAEISAMVSRISQ